jgi:hypothetical protein
MRRVAIQDNWKEDDLKILELMRYKKEINSKILISQEDSKSLEETKILI